MLNIIRFQGCYKGLFSSICIHNLKPLKRNAGHSKWSNIKHIKGAKDAEKSKIFNRMSRQMRLAIEEGGGTDPNKNARLASIIEQAKQFNMPMASIKSAIEKCKEIKPGDQKSFHLEMRGPGGCIVIISVLTDNTYKAKANLNTIARKLNCSFIEGAIGSIFEHKALIQADPPDKTTLEMAVDHAIEVGAEDVTEEKEEDGDGVLLQFVCEPALLNQVKGKIVKLGYNVRTCDCEFIPNSHVSLTDAQLQEVEKLFEKLESEPSIVRLFDNIA